MIGADLDELLDLRRELGTAGWHVGHDTDAVAHALATVQARSTEFVPVLPPHEARGADLADRLHELGRRVDRTRDALIAADRWIGVELGSSAFEWDARRRRAQDGWHGVRGGWSLFRRGVLGRTATAGDAAVDATLASWSWGAQVDDTVGSWRHLTGGGASPVAGAGAVGSGRFAETLARFRATRAGSAVRLGGRAVAIAGIAASGYEVYEGVREGDRAKVTTGTLGVLAGGAMLSGIPPLQVAGAIVSGGLLVYEYREEIAAGAAWVADGAADMAAAVGDFFDGLF